jgi:hypothetical protein
MRIWNGSIKGSARTPISRKPRDDRRFRKGEPPGRHTDVVVRTAPSCGNDAANEPVIDDRRTDGVSLADLTNAKSFWRSWSRDALFETYPFVSR